MKPNGLPQATVRQVPITRSDREAMLHKHPLEGKPHIIGIEKVGPKAHILHGRTIHEVYHWQHEGVEKIYDIRAIKDAIYHDKVETVVLELTFNAAYVNHLFEYGGCEQKRIEEITSKDIERPALGVLYSDGMQVIDGSHRLVARYRRFKKPTARIMMLDGDEIDAKFLLPPSEFRPIR